MPAEAWQPLTFGGVAAFAGAPAGRLLLVAAIVALWVSGTVFRFALTVGSPTISAAIARLPGQGAVDSGQLVWSSGQAISLTENAFVSVSVTPAGVPPVAQTADFQFEFRATSLYVSSLLGYTDFPYPRGYVFALNRTELDPLWGAWRPHLLAAVAGTTFAGLLVLWAALATLLAVPLRAYALLLDRQPSLGGCWKLAFAALLPGALIMGGAVLAYSLRRLSLGELMLVNGLQLLVNTAYWLISPLRLPAGPSPTPFSEAPPPIVARANPFAGPEPNGSCASPAEPTRDAGEQIAPEHPIAGARTPRPPLGPTKSPLRDNAGSDTPFNPS